MTGRADFEKRIAWALFEGHRKIGQAAEMEWYWQRARQIADALQALFSAAEIEVDAC